MNATRRRTVVAAAALVLVLGAAAWWWMAAQRRPTAPDAAVVALGAAVYGAHCAACHGAAGEGAPDWRRQNADGTFPPPPHDADGHTWHHADGLLYRIVRDGGAAHSGPGFRSAMPGFAHVLEPHEIRAVIVFLSTWWSDEQRAFQARASEGDPFPPEAHPASAR